MKEDNVNSSYCNPTFSFVDRDKNPVILDKFIEDNLLILQSIKNDKQLDEFYHLMMAQIVALLNALQKQNFPALRKLAKEEFYNNILHYSCEESTFYIIPQPEYEIRVCIDLLTEAGIKIIVYDIRN